MHLGVRRERKRECERERAVLWLISCSHILAAVPEEVTFWGEIAGGDNESGVTGTEWVSRLKRPSQGEQMEIYQHSYMKWASTATAVSSRLLFSVTVWSFMLTSFFWQILMYIVYCHWCTWGSKYICFKPAVILMQALSDCLNCYIL